MSRKTSQTAPAPHPCQRCGACCAYFRVSFYWREAEPGGAARPVPRELTEDSSSFLRVMKGTAGKHHARCVALEGEVGREAHCSIYSLRPTPCRSFLPSFEDGRRQPRCDQARARYGLPALSKEDWRGFPAEPESPRLARGEMAATIEGNDKS